MQGPAKIVRSSKIPNYEYLDPLFEWAEGNAYLTVDHVRYANKEGAVFTYSNPPVHQIGNPALAAFLKGFEALDPLEEDLWFVLFHSACDPVHAGGDLKESLERLQASNAERDRLQAAGADAAEISALFDWGDARIDKGFALYRKFREWGDKMRTVATCGGGTRFGGSAEVVLMSDEIVADSRSAMCFSESQIGLIPGWGGVGRAITKAGVENARAMAATARIVKAPDLEVIGIFNEVLLTGAPLPKKGRTSDPEADKSSYLKALQRNDDEMGKALFIAALDKGTDSAGATFMEPFRRRTLVKREEVDAEIARRSNPQTYEGLWGKPLKEASEAVADLGKPLAPQSIERLDALLADVNPRDWNGEAEEAFIRAEGRVDAELYRDPRFVEGILATLQQRVADFREVDKP
jgi:enoyl-CoA hydratase/carnithine racemase